MLKKYKSFQIFLILLFLCKPLYKAFVYMNYFWCTGCKRFAKSLELTDNYQIVRIDNYYCCFYKMRFGQYEAVTYSPQHNS